MDANTRRRIDQCIREIEQITRELRQVSSTVPQYSKGVDSKRFQNDLNEAARMYEKAASQLRRL